MHRLAAKSFWALLAVSCATETSAPPGQSLDLDSQDVDAAPPTDDAPNASDVCAHTVAPASLLPSNLLFVIDRSGSMNCNLPEDGQSSDECARSPLPRSKELPTKWALTRAALNDTLDALARWPSMHAGLSLFPERGGTCSVLATPRIAIAPLGDSQRQTIDDELAGVEPEGDTPLAGAAILGFAHVYEQLVSGALQGPSQLVILTDGSETCKPDELEKLVLEDVPNAYRKLGVRTFVIGAPGSESARALLSRMAIQGGTARSEACLAGPEDTTGDCHFDMTTTDDFSADLLSALAVIRGEIIPCELPLPQPGSGQMLNLTEVNVSLDGEAIPRDDSDCGSQDLSGWQYTEDLERLRLCGRSCNDAQRPGASVRVTLGCPTIPR